MERLDDLHGLSGRSHECLHCVSQRLFWGLGWMGDVGWEMDGGIYLVGMGGGAMQAIVVVFVGEESWWEGGTTIPIVDLQQSTKGPEGTPIV